MRVLSIRYAHMHIHAALLHPILNTVTATALWLRLQLVPVHTCLISLMLSCLSETSNSPQSLVSCRMLSLVTPGKIVPSRGGVISSFTWLLACVPDKTISSLTWLLAFVPDKTINRPASPRSRLQHSQKVLIYERTSSLCNNISTTCLLQKVGLGWHALFCYLHHALCKHVQPFYKPPCCLV